MTNKNDLPASPNAEDERMPDAAQVENTTGNATEEIPVSIESIKEISEASVNDTKMDQVESVPEVEQATSDIHTSTDSLDYIEKQITKPDEESPINTNSVSNKKTELSDITEQKQEEKDQQKNIYVLTKEFLFTRFHIRLNSFTQQLEGKAATAIDYAPVTDRVLNTLVVLCNENKICTNKTIVALVINTTHYTKTYNPLEEYLNGLPEWNDGVDYIEKLADKVQVASNPNWKNWFKRYFVAMVASGLFKDEHNEMMLILYGKQSVGKTTFIRNLIPAPLQKYYYSGMLNPASDEFFAHLTKFLLINLDELVGVSRKMFKELKEVLSKKKIHHRIKYDRHGQDYPRIASIAGTSNVKEFLYDLTGNRRFISVEALSIDYQSDYQLDKAYAQAYSLLKVGDFKYWFDKEDVPALEANNKQFLDISPEEEKIVEYFQPCEKGDENVLLTATEVAEAIFTMKGRQVPSDIVRKIGSIMTRLGFHKKKKANGNQAYAVKIENIDKLIEIQAMVDQVWRSS